MINKNKISIVVITKNEELMIEGCLRSIAWADEIIIIDDFSEDKTLEISKKYTNKIYKRKFTGFASQKNYGILKSSSEWILILDADERVSGNLKNRIQELIVENNNYCYNILFKNFFLGREMRYGGWQDEYHMRLFKNKRAFYKNQEIHEILKTRDQDLPLTECIYHFSHRDLASNLLKTRQYALKESQYNYERGVYPKVTRWSLFKNIIDHFILRYIKAKGYKDGMEGFIEAVYQSFSQMFIVQAMTWERQREETSKDLYKKLDKKLEENNFSI